MTLENCKILNRDQIKLLAVVTMNLNHFANVFQTPGRSDERRVGKESYHRCR